MKKLLISTAFVAMIASAAVAETPAGSDETNCDPTAFVAVKSADGLRTLYWNNPTCSMSGGSGVASLRFPDDAQPGDVFRVAGSEATVTIPAN